MMQKWKKIVTTFWLYLEGLKPKSRSKTGIGDAFAKLATGVESQFL